MDNLLIFGGLLLFIIGIVMLITSFVKKTKKKKAILLILIGFVVWIVGGAIASPSETSNDVKTKELSLIMGMDIDDASKSIGFTYEDMGEEIFDLGVFKFKPDIGDWIFKTDDTGKIIDIEVFDDEYTLFGVTNDTKDDEARQILEKNGFTQLEEGIFISNDAHYKMFTKPFIEYKITDNNSDASSSEKVQTQDDALLTFKLYADKEKATEKYDKFDCAENGNTFLLIAGHSEDGDEWDYVGDLYSINKSDGNIEFLGKVEDMLAEQEAVKEVEEAGNGSTTNEDFYSFNGIDVYNLSMEKSGFGKRVEGLAENKTGAIVNAYISFVFYDEENIQVGTEEVALQHLAPGAKAKIEIPSLLVPSGTEKFDIVDIEVYNDN